jgi:hypothetical protein
MILESDASWKERMESKLTMLEAGLNVVSGHLGVSLLIDSGQTREYSAHTPSSSSPPPPRRPSINDDHHPPQNFEIVMDPESGPAALPGSVVSPVIGADGQSRDRAGQDVIRRGIVTLERAQSYLDVYQNRLDHFLYRILGDRRTLAEVRSASPLLLAAVCTVGALHLTCADFEKCYKEFVAIAAAQTFSRRNNVDDVRGLCIAAFWLSGITWPCIGSAVRIATELQLHRSIFKALSGDRDHYLRTRLYYLVYVCDHQSSIAYGRPPMTRQCDSISAASRFIETEHICEDDLRLVSQVHFWTTITEGHSTFGVDVDRPLDLSTIELLRRLSIKLDGVRSDWTERFTRNEYVGNYPRKGVGLHYHFAKLYLYSMAFRGVDRPGFKDVSVALDIEELARVALLSATAILRAIIHDAEIQGYLNGLPTYFDVMIAFVIVFLLKVSSPKYSPFVVRVDTGEMHSLVAEVISVLKTVTAGMHRSHLLVSVVQGAADLLDKCTTAADGCHSDRVHLDCTADPAHPPGTVEHHHTIGDDNLLDGSLFWNGAPWDNLLMGEFDLLASNDALPNGGLLPGAYST